MLCVEDRTQFCLVSSYGGHRRTREVRNPEALLRWEQGEHQAKQTKTSAEAGSGSFSVRSGVPGGIRTHDLLFRRQAL